MLVYKRVSSVIDDLGLDLPIQTSVLMGHFPSMFWFFGNQAAGSAISVSQVFYGLRN
jgi:hypothetical protein